MLRVIPLAVFGLIWSVGFANAQESSPWAKLPKLDLEKQIQIHVDKAVVAAGIEITDWRWFRKGDTIAAKVTLKKELPAGIQLQYTSFKIGGFAKSVGPLVDGKGLKVNETAIGWVPVRPTPEKTERVFIFLSSEKKENKSWSKLLKDPALEQAKPARGFVDSAAEFATLWTAWFGNEKMPEIDFEKKVVIVATSTKFYIHSVHLIDNKGDVQVYVGFGGYPVAAGKECDCRLLAVDREGIKTIQGKSISK